jgi:hypothetical protein
MVALGRPRCSKTKRWFFDPGETGAKEGCTGQTGLTPVKSAALLTIVNFTPMEWKELNSIGQAGQAPVKHPKIEPLRRQGR